MGPLSATEALNRSRNVPAVELSARLRPGLYDLLSRARVGDLRPPEWYGLSIALGGIDDALRAETRSPWAPPVPPPGLARIPVCAISGRLPGPHCRHTEPTWFLPGTSPIDTCDVHREVLVDRDGRRACRPGPGVRREVFELWRSNLLELFADAGIPRRVPPPGAPGCRLEDLAAEGLPPRITSPQQGVTYAVRVDEVGRQTVPLTAVTEGDTREVYWFVDAELVGKAARGEPLPWRARPGRFVVRAVDDHGRAGAVRVDVSVVE